jgi:3-methyladenine DNA glycosylase AlkC
MEKKARFLPFHAINEYMLDDYRQLVIQSVLGNFNKLSEERQRKINSLIKNHVRVQGFRNSTVAPLPLKINGCIDTYKKSPEFVAQILGAWSEINSETKKTIFGYLECFQ